jgi:L-fuconolactonase
VLEAPYLCYKENSIHLSVWQWFLPIASSLPLNFLFVRKDPAFLARKEFIKGVKALASFDLSYDLLIYPHQIESAISFCQTCNDQRIVLDHLAKAPLKSGDISAWKKQISRFKELDHVSAKISGIVTEASDQNWTPDQVNEIVDVALAIFGPSRLLIGSDYPVVLLNSTLERWVNTFENQLGSLSSSEQAKIYEGLT